jgi:MSHA pilin protein MshD
MCTDWRTAPATVVPPARRRPRQCGFTLIEMIAFILIISIALAAIVNVLANSSRGSADPLRPKQAMLVAESMLEEVLLKAYANPAEGYTCAGTCDRKLYDDVSDYQGYTSSGVYALDDLATPVPGLEGYSVKVDVSNVVLPAAANSAAAKLITVTVRVAGTDYDLSGYRFNYD